MRGGGGDTGAAEGAGMRAVREVAWAYSLRRRRVSRRPLRQRGAAGREGEGTREHGRSWGYGRTREREG
jgi:hypothetical protein